MNFLPIQKNGIEKGLLKKAIIQIKKDQKNIDELTVNASPNAVNAYLKLGFKAKTDEQCIIAFDSS